MKQCFLNQIANTNLFEINIMIKKLTPLQQFLGGYFNQDWVDDHGSAEEVIAVFIEESTAEVRQNVKLEIIKLLATCKIESELQHNLLHEQHCYYYYPHEWPSGKLWLEHVIKKFDEVLQE